MSLVIFISTKNADEVAVEANEVIIVKPLYSPAEEKKGCTLWVRNGLAVDVREDLKTVVRRIEQGKR